MPHEGYADPIMNDGPGFYSNMPVSELTEHVARAIKASNVSSSPLVAETVDGVTHGTRPTPAKPNGAQRLRPPDINSGNQPTVQVADETNTGEHPERRNTGVYGPQKECQDTQPPTDSPVGCRLGGYTHRVHSRAPAGKSKNPPDDST